MMTVGIPREVEKAAAIKELSNAAHMAAVAIYMHRNTRTDHGYEGYMRDAMDRVNVALRKLRDTPFKPDTWI